MGAEKQLGNQKMSAILLVFHVFSLQGIHRSRSFDPGDSMKVFRHVTPHCAEFSTYRFAMVDFLGTLIWIAATCQRFTLYCVGNPARLPELIYRYWDSNAPLKPYSDKHGDTISSSTIKPEIFMISLKSR